MEWMQEAPVSVYLSAIVLVREILLWMIVLHLNVSSIVTDVTSDVSSLSLGENLTNDLRPKDLTCNVTPTPSSGVCSVMRESNLFISLILYRIPSLQLETRSLWRCTNSQTIVRVLMKRLVELIMGPST